MLRDTLRYAASACALILLAGLAAAVAGPASAGVVASGGGSIAGTVTDTNGNELYEIDISVWEKVDGAWRFVSDRESGTGYRFDRLEPGAYRLHASSRSRNLGHFFEEWYSDAPTVEDADDVVVTEGQTATANFELKPWAKVTGTVRDEANEPLSDILVTMYAKDADGQWQSRDTSVTCTLAQHGGCDDHPDGSYIVEFPEPGTYRIGFSNFRPEERPVLFVDEFYDNASSVEAADDLTVTTDSMTTGIDATLARAADTTAPESQIDSGPADGSTTNYRHPEFTYSGTPAADTDHFECSLDHADFEDCPASGMRFNDLDDGSHTFAVRAVDAAGNVDESPATRTWTIDTVSPQTTITSGPSGLSLSSKATFTFTSSEAGSSFHCRMDAGSWQACTSPQTYDGVRGGSHSFAVRATDKAGNPPSVPAQRTWFTLALMPF